MQWVKWAITLLVAWIKANTAAKVRRAMAAEAKLHREREKLLRVSALEEKRVEEYGTRAVRHSRAAATAKLRVLEIEKEMGLWDESQQ